MLKRIVCLFLLLPGLLMAEKIQPIDEVVAIVNDDVITKNQLMSQTTQLKSQLKAKKMQLPADSVLHKQVLQHMIDVDIQLQLAKRNGISVDNSEVDQAIKKIAKNNRLSVTQLRKQLAGTGLNWTAYRDNIKKEMVLSRLQQKAVGSDIKVSQEQVKDYLALAQKDTKSQLSYHVRNILIPLSDSPSSNELIAAKKVANELYQKIKKGEDFSRLALSQSSGEFALDGGDLGFRHLAELPSLFAQTISHMKPGEVSKPIRASNGYHLLKLEGVKGDKPKHMVKLTKVRHILVKQDPSMTEREARRQVNNLYQQLIQGKEFAAIAKQYSLDPSSATKGGELGWVHPGELVPEFEHAMEKLAIKQISKPVKSQFGWHIIQVLNRKKIDDSKTYEAQKIRQLLYQRKFNEAVQNWQQQLRTEAFVKIIDKKARA